MTPLRFAHIQRNPSAGVTGYAPLLLLDLEKNQRTITASGLLDTGVAVNVLPYSIGTALGFAWEKETPGLALGGNINATATRMIVINATIGSLATVPLVFTWTQTDAVPLILGQVNFFMEFDACFFRTQLAFEITPKAAL